MEEFQISPTKYMCDPLILSCVRYRLPEKHYSFTSFDIEKDITEEDKVMASAIRKYYLGELMKMGLTGKPVSKFRQDLAVFISEVKTELSSESEGMVYKLPEFYQYDLEVDAIPEKYEVLSANENHVYPGSFTLEPLFKHMRRTRKDSCFQYWFKTTQNLALCITIEKSNKLLKLWDQLFDSKTYITLVDLKPKVISKGNFSFIYLNNWSWGK